MSKNMWPFPRARHAVVFLDYMNAYLTHEQFYQGSTDPRRIFDDCQRLTSKFVAQKAQVVAFANLRKYEQITPSHWSRFILGARDRDVRVIHVPSDCGIDQVDGMMFDAMRFAHERLPRSIPFALVTLDKHFIPVTAELKREGRPMLNVLPTTNRFPAIARAGHMYEYLDSNAWLYVALFAAFAVDADREDPAISMNKPPLYFHALNCALGLLGRLRGRYLKANSPRALMGHIERISRSLPERGVLGSTKFVTDSLLHYGLFDTDADGYQVYGYSLNESHPALRRLRQPIAL